MFSGDGMVDGLEDRYAAFGFWKIDDSTELECVRKKPQSYGY
jgi:hypothetical protein